MKKAIVLLSGGLDSATTLYIAKKEGFSCFCLIFDYGQRHRREIESAKRLAQIANCKSQIIKISLPWKGSSLLDKSTSVPKQANRQIPNEANLHRASSGSRSDTKEVTTFGTGKQANRIPSTYVPGRNIIFLSFALSYAEAIGASKIFIGVHAQDYSGYPDCRPEFYRAFDLVSARGTKAGVEKKKIEIKTPLINKSKAQIIEMGRTLGVPFQLTWSCYRGKHRPCGACDSCYFRAKGFKDAGLKDPLL